MPGVFKVGSLQSNTASIQQLSLNDIENLKAVVEDLQQNINKFNAIIGEYNYTEHGNLDVLHGNIETLEDLSFLDDAN